MKLYEVIDLCTKEENFFVELQGNREIEIDGLNFCDRKSRKKSILSFATNEKYKTNVEEAEYVKALIVTKKNAQIYEKIIEERQGCLIISDDPEIDFYKIHSWLYYKTKFYKKYDFQSRIGENCKIESTAIIEKGVIIGNNVTIGAGSIIKKGTIIDDNVIIGCGSIIGSEGFQVIKAKRIAPIHVMHVGRCHICSNVYIGDKTCICKSLFEGETYIGIGSKIDNFVQIAHNLYIGKNVVVTAHVVFCGSCVVQDDAWIAPNVSVLNRVVIGKGAKVGMGSVVTRNVEPNTVVYGCPAKKHK